MCECAAGAINCMSRPGVADLRCTDCGCCDASTLTLADIDADTLAWFDAGSVPGGPGETADAAELALMADYAAAVEMAWERIASRVCMARYVGECELSLVLCSPTSATRSVCRCTDGTCPAGLFLPELSEQVHPSRIGAVTSGGDPVSLDGSDPAAAWTLTTHDGYRLHGPIPSSLTVQVREQVPLFVEAVRSLACKLVPGVHGSECSIGGGAALLARDDADPFGDPFADALLRDCYGPGGWAGRQSAVVSLRWDAGIWTPPAPTADYRSFGWVVFETGVPCTVGDGIAGCPAPAWMNGYNVTDVLIATPTPGTTGTMDAQLRRVRAGVPVDVLSTKVTLNSGAQHANDGVVNTSNDDIATGDLFYLDRDSIHGTPAEGLSVMVTVQLP